MRCDGVLDHSAVVCSLKLLFGVCLRYTCERQRQRAAQHERTALKRLKTLKHLNYELSSTGSGMHKFTAHAWYSSRREKDAGRRAVRGGKKEERGERAGRITDRLKLLEQCWVGVRVWIVARVEAGLTGTDGFLSPPVLLVLLAESVETRLA